MLAKVIGTLVTGELSTQVYIPIEFMIPTIQGRILAGCIDRGR